MAFLIGGANSAADTGFSVDNSCRFDGSTAYMSKTMGTATNRLKLTMSVWLKRSALGERVFFSSYYSASFRFQFYFDGSDRLAVLNVDSGSTNVSLITNRVFRDVSAYYHVQVVIDTTEASSSNRVKLYVNGTQETSFATSTYPAENADMSLGASSYTANIGRYGGDSDYFSGYMAEFVYLDGQTLAPTSCGEFDEDSPTIWKPIDVSELTFGDEGWYLDFEDSDNLGDDESGNTSDLAETNLAAADQATDSPTNNFCTMNPLVPHTNVVISEGNCKWVSDGSDTYGGGIGTFGLTAGKWWFEVKISSLVSNHNHGAISELTTELYNTAGGAAALQNDTGVTCWRNDDGGELVLDGTATTNDYGLFSDGQIMGIALDIDNYNISIYRDGSALASDVNMSSTRGTIFPFINTGISTTAEVNFGGCSSFTISSAANDANGHGVFEHAPPSGYLALCSKNLGSTGG